MKCITDNNRIMVSLWSFFLMLISLVHLKLINKKKKLNKYNDGMVGDWIFFWFDFDSCVCVCVYDLKKSMKMC
jgi:hypothetical protein